MIISEKTDLNLFHDARVGMVNYDYANKSINIHLFLDSPTPSIKGEADLKATVVNSAQLGSSEPWGAGIYISEVKVEDKTKYKRLSVILNSGDTFVIDAQLFELIM